MHRNVPGVFGKALCVLWFSSPASAADDAFCNPDVFILRDACKGLHISGVSVATSYAESDNLSTQDGVGRRVFFFSFFSLFVESDVAGEVCRERSGGGGGGRCGCSDDAGVGRRKVAHALHEHDIFSDDDGIIMVSLEPGG